MSVTSVKMRKVLLNMIRKSVMKEEKTVYLFSFFRALENNSLRKIANSSIKLLKEIGYNSVWALANSVRVAVATR